MKNKSKIIVILGPTSSGKTSLSLKLAKKFNGEIISADSRQLYKGMDIATGKIPLDSNGYYKDIPHHMIDVIGPDEEFSVAQYKEKAIEIAKDIVDRDKIPFLVGGTGLYIQAVVDNFSIPKVLPSKKLREDFENELEESEDKRVVLDKWYKKLLELDPEAKDIVANDNPRRIIRALEVSLATKKPFSETRKKGETIFDALQLGIEVSREKLYERIDNRVDEMMEEGLLDEVKGLIKKKYNTNLPSMSGIGYKEIGEYLKESFKINNEKTRKKILEEKLQEMKYRTHRYARRQGTWFRKDKRIKWVESYKEAEEKIKEWII